MAKTAARKVFCIGWPDTGLASLAAALKILRYRLARPVGLGETPDALDAFGREIALDEAARADACVGAPYFAFWTDLDAAFPGARFILTTRETAGWHSSISEAIDERSRNMAAYVLGAENADPAACEAVWKEAFERHAADVRAHFEGRPDDLLVLSADEPFLWGEICDFLDRPVPSVAFPERSEKKSRAGLVARARDRFDKIAERIGP